jgi:hypothetical protein
MPAYGAVELKSRIPDRVGVVPKGHRAMARLAERTGVAPPPQSWCGRTLLVLPGPWGRRGDVPRERPRRAPSGGRRSPNPQARGPTVGGRPRPNRYATGSRAERFGPGRSIRLPRCPNTPALGVIERWVSQITVAEARESGVCGHGVVRTWATHRRSRSMRAGSVVGSTPTVSQILPDRLTSAAVLRA